MCTSVAPAGCAALRTDTCKTAACATGMLRCWLQTPDGSLAPGKKGILLTVQQFTTLASHVSAISSAVSAKDTGFELDLGNK